MGGWRETLLWSISDRPLTRGGKANQSSSNNAVMMSSPAGVILTCAEKHGKEVK